jgi:PAS domain S-box-containing protein
MKPCFEQLLEASGNPEMRLGSSESRGHALNRAPAWYAESKYACLWGIMHSDLAFAAFDGFERELLELLPAAVCICEAPSGVITHYNRRAGELWGAYPNPGEAVYCGAAKLYVDGEFVAHEKSPMARVLKTGVPVHGLEVEMERRDGSRIMAICDIEPLRDRTGRIVRAIHIFQDITDRKRTENLRARERQLLQQIAAGAPLAEILQNLALLVEGSTPGGVASILLLDPDGMHLWPAAAPKLPDEWIGAISPLRIGPNVGSCGTAAYRKDMVVTHDIATDPLWTDYRDLALGFGLRACWSTPIVASDGRLLGTFAVYYRKPHSPDRQEIETVRFITGTAAIALERRRNEEQLRESADALRNQQRWLQAVLDLMPMPMLFIEPGSGCTTFANRAANEMAGGRFPTGCPIDKYDTVYYCTDAQGRRIPNHEMPAARIARGERLEAFEMNWQSPAGERPLIIFGDTLPAMHGHPAVGVLMFEDITRMKQTEEALRQAQKMESLGVLAGGIAHDFNNLLVAIMGNASLVLEDMPDDSPSLHLVENVLRASQRAADLTRQMLAYSGQGRFVVQQLDLSEEVREIGSLIQSSIPKSVALQMNLSRNLPPVLADSSQIQQIIMNLIINGAEAIGEERSGSITVTTGAENFEPAPGRRLLPAEPPPGCYVFLEVRDTGDGMDESIKSRIFDPFFTTKFTGRGLGLAAVLGIVRAHKGAVQVDSAPGAGTTVRVLFPAAAEAGEQCVTAEQPQELTGSGLILVVDDEEAVAETAQAALEHYGYTVLLARDGIQAEQLFRSDAGRIALVLLDMTMPALSGEETLRRLAAIRPGVPVILSSGYGEQHAHRRFHGKTAGFLQKPYSAAELAACVKRVLGGQERTQAA